MSTLSQGLPSFSHPTRCTRSWETTARTADPDWPKGCFPTIECHAPDRTGEASRKVGLLLRSRQGIEFWFFLQAVSNCICASLVLLLLLLLLLLFLLLLLLFSLFVILLNCLYLNPWVFSHSSPHPLNDLIISSSTSICECFCVMHWHPRKIQEHTLIPFLFFKKV